MIRWVDTLKQAKNHKKLPAFSPILFVKAKGLVSYNFGRSWKIKPQKTSASLMKKTKKKEAGEGEVIPAEIYKQLSDILPDSRWIKWMKLYLLMNRYYSDFWKVFAFFVTGVLVFGFYSIYFVAKHPKKMVSLKSLLEEEIENAAIGKVMQDLKAELYSKYKDWSAYHFVIQKSILQILLALHMDPNEAYLYYKSSNSLQFIETHEQDCFSQLLLFQLFNMANFEELFANQKVVYLKIKGAPEHDKQKNILKELKIAVKGIKEIIDEVKLKNIRGTSSRSQSMIFIIDNVQELSVYLESAERKKQLLETFDQLKHLQQSGKVNVYAISFDSLFVNDLVTELNEKEENFTKTVKPQINRETVDTMVQNVKQNNGEYSELTHLFGQFLDRLDKMKTINMLLEVCRVCTQLKWTAGHPADTMNEICPQLQTLVEQKQLNIRKEVKRAVFKGDQVFCHKKIKLLIKLLLYYSDSKVWKDWELAIESLSSEQVEVYRDLCRSKILFYLTFYKEEYEREFFSIVKENSFYHSLFKEVYGQMKEQNEVQSDKAAQYYSQIMSKAELKRKSASKGKAPAK